MRLLEATCIMLLAVGVLSQSKRPYKVAKVLSSTDSITENEVEDNSLSSHLMDLVPEFSTAINSITSKPGNMQPMDMISAFLPIIHKAMEAQAAGANQRLTEVDDANMAMMLTVMELSAKTIGDLMSPKHSSDAGNVITSFLDISRPIIEANAKREGRPLKKVEKEFIYYFENGFKFFIESMKDYTKEITPENMVKATSKVALYVLGARARVEGRQVSYQEKEVVKAAENQVLTTIDIMRGFYGEPGIKDLTNNFMRLFTFIMTSKATSEIPKRWSLTYQERLLINRTDNALSNLGSLVSNIHQSSATSEELGGFGNSTLKLWGVQAEKEERNLAPEEIRYLQFIERIINLPKSIYNAVVPF